MEPQEVLDFWFGDGEIRFKFWFSAETDILIKKKFTAVLEEAAAGKLDTWKDSALGRLALIILFDQFTRNIFRAKKEAFAYDGKARELCKEGIELRQDKKLNYIQRSFFYMPLQHSEDVKDQELSIEVCKELLEEFPEKYVEGVLKCAFEHKAIIDRFGRFPHRNTVLDRQSTAEEELYLKTAKRYGQ